MNRPETIDSSQTLKNVVELSGSRSYRKQKFGKANVHLS